MDENEKKKKEQEEADKKTIETIVEAVTEKSIDRILEKIKTEKPLRKDIFGDGGSSSEKAELAEKKNTAAEYIKKLALGQDTKALTSGSATNGGVCQVKCVGGIPSTFNRKTALKANGELI